MGGVQKAHHPGVRGLRRDPDARDGSETRRPDARREGHADVPDALRGRESSAYLGEVRQRGVGGSRKDQPAQRPSLPDSVY